VRIVYHEDRQGRAWIDEVAPVGEAGDNDDAEDDRQAARSNSSGLLTNSNGRSPATTVAADPHTELRRLRAAALSAAAHFAPDDYTEQQVLTCAGRFLGWIQTGAGVQASASAATNEAPQQEVSQPTAPPAAALTPTDSEGDGGVTSVDVAGWVASSHYDPATVLAALGLKSTSAQVVPSHIDAWCRSGPKGETRTPAGAQRIIRHAIGGS